MEGAPQGEKEESMEDAMVGEQKPEKKDQMDHNEGRWRPSFLEKGENKENPCALSSRRSSIAFSSRSTTSGQVDFEGAGSFYSAGGGPPTEEEARGSAKSEEDEQQSPHFATKQKPAQRYNAQERLSTPELWQEESLEAAEHAAPKSTLHVFGDEAEGGFLCTQEPDRSSPRESTEERHLSAGGDAALQGEAKLIRATDPAHSLSAPALLDTPRCLSPFPRSSLRLRELRNLVRSTACGEASSQAPRDARLLSSPPRVPRGALSPPWRGERFPASSLPLLPFSSADVSRSTAGNVFATQGKHRLTLAGSHTVPRCPDENATARRTASSPCTDSSRDMSLSSARGSSEHSTMSDGACWARGTSEEHLRLPYERTISSPRPLSPSLSRHASPSRRLGSLLGHRPRSLSAYSHTALSLADRVCSSSTCRGRAPLPQPSLDGNRSLPVLDESFLGVVTHRPVSSLCSPLPLSFCSASQCDVSRLQMRDEDTLTDPLLSRRSCVSSNHPRCASSSGGNSLSSQDSPAVTPTLSPNSVSPSSSAKDPTPPSAKSRRGGESLRAKFLLDLRRQRESEEEDFYEMTTARHVEEVARLQREMAELRRELKEKALRIEATEQEISARTEEARALTWQAETARERQAREREHRERLEAKVRELAERLSERDQTAKKKRREQASAWTRKLHEERETFRAELATLQKDKAELEASAQRLREQVLKLTAQARRAGETKEEENAAPGKNSRKADGRTEPPRREHGNHPSASEREGIGSFLRLQPEKANAQNQNGHRDVDQSVQKHSPASAASDTPLLLPSRMANEEVETCSLVVEEEEDDNDGDGCGANVKASEDEHPERNSPSFLATELFLRHAGSLAAQTEDLPHYCHFLSRPAERHFSSLFSDALARRSWGGRSLTRSSSLCAAMKQSEGTKERACEVPLLSRSIRLKSLAEEFAECGEEERNTRPHLLTKENKHAGEVTASRFEGHKDEQQGGREDQGSKEKEGKRGSMAAEHETEGSGEASGGVPSPALGEAHEAPPTSGRKLREARASEATRAFDGRLSESMLVEPEGNKEDDRHTDVLLLLSPVNNLNMKDLEKFIDLEQGTEETLASEGERETEQLMSDRTLDGNSQGGPLEDTTKEKNVDLRLLIAFQAEDSGGVPSPSASRDTTSLTRSIISAEYHPPPPHLLSPECRGSNEPRAVFFSPAGPTGGAAPAEGSVGGASSSTAPRCPRKVRTLWNVLTTKGLGFLFWICPRRRGHFDEDSFDADDAPPADETTALVGPGGGRRNSAESDGWV